MKLIVSRLHFSPYCDGGRLLFQIERPVDDFKVNDKFNEYIYSKDWSCTRYPINTVKVEKTYGVYNAYFASEEEPKDLVLMQSKLFQAVSEFIHNEKQKVVDMYDAELSMLDQLDIEINK